MKIQSSFGGVVGWVSGCAGGNMYGWALAQETLA